MTVDIAESLRAMADEHAELVCPPAAEAALADLVARCVAELGGAPPPELLDVLSDQDGFEVNGLRVFAARDTVLPSGVPLPGLVEHNRDLREGGGLDAHVVMAQGSSALFALHLPTGQFHELGVVPADVLAVHPTFAGLMTSAIGAHR